MNNLEQNKILMLDDEVQDIENLEKVLDDALFKMWGTIGAREYASNPYEALEILKEDMSNGKRYSAIISDNHMGDLSGDDFLRIISGNVAYCYDSSPPYDLNLNSFKTFPDLQRYLTGHIQEDSISEFMEEFENLKDYTSLVNYYFNKSKSPKIVLWCGSPSEANLTGLESIVAPFQKPIRHRENGESYPSELDVLKYLSAEGVFKKENITNALTNHIEFHTHAAYF